MKLKDIVPYCLDFSTKPYSTSFNPLYFWVLRGFTYTIDSFESYCPPEVFDEHIHLSRYNFCNHDEIQKKYDPDNNYLSLNLYNEITIFDKFIMSDKCGYYPDRSDYHPNSKYKIVQFTNGLGKTWYKIKIVGYLWDSYYKMYYNTDYGWTGFVPYFDSEQEALEHLKRDKEQYHKMRLLNTISSKEGAVCEI